MNFFSLLKTELLKIRRTHIFWLMLVPCFLLWLPAVLNVDQNFQNASGLSPENNFFIQGFMGFAWILFPALLVVFTVMLNQLERTNRGLQKMLSLPVNPGLLCLAKFLILLLLAAVLLLLMLGFYYPAAALAGQRADADLLLAGDLVLKEALLIYLCSVPMAAFYWLIAVCVRVPVFSMGIGLASVVPSVLIMNTKAWFLYPMCYPFYTIMKLMGSLSDGKEFLSLDLIQWLPAAAGFTGICILLSCLLFGRSERR